MEFTDGGITLRHPTDADAAAVTEAVRASLDELGPFMPWATDAFDESSALAWIRGEIAPGAEDFVVVDAAGAVIGGAGLHPLDAKDQRIELGYWIRTDRTGAGAATRATRLLARHAIEVRGAHRVEIFMSVENEASRRVAEKTGATYEGVARGRIRLHGRHHDAHVWSLLAGDL